MQRRIAVSVLLLSAIAISAWAVVGPPGPPTKAPGPAAKYQKPGDYLDSLMIDGVRRLFTVHIPVGYLPGGAMPLVFNIHGRTATAFQQAEMSRMNAKADQEGLIVVYPQALGNPPTWWGPIPSRVGQPDMDFFQALLAYLQREVSIDPACIFATGMSNSATMVNRLACDMSQTFAAIAPVSGGHVASDECQVERPVPVFVFHGVKDPIIPYHGNDVDAPPVHAWIQVWAERNGCNLTPSASRPHPAIVRETWADCDGGAEVTLYSLEEAGHTWPGSQFGARMGGFTLDIDATDVIWDFFEAHPHP